MVHADSQYVSGFLVQGHLGCCLDANMSVASLSTAIWGVAWMPIYQWLPCRQPSRVLLGCQYVSGFLVDSHLGCCLDANMSVASLSTAM